MAIELKCTGCSRTLRVGEEHAGKRALCPECNTIVLVPELTDVLAGGDVPLGKSPFGTAEQASEFGLAPDWLMRTPEGQTFGPVPRAELDRWYADGRVTADCWLRTEDAANEDWRMAEHVFPSLRPRMAKAPLAASTHNPYTSSSLGANSYQVPHRGGLILGLALCSWLICTAFPVFGFAAWIMGSNDLREMRMGRMDSSGMGLTQAGQILGMIHSVLFILCFVLFFFLVLMGAALG